MASVAQSLTKFHKTHSDISVDSIYNEFLRALVGRVRLNARKSIQFPNFQDFTSPTAEKDTETIVFLELDLENARAENQKLQAQVNYLTQLLNKKSNL